DVLADESLQGGSPADLLKPPQARAQNRRPIRYAVHLPARRRDRLQADGQSGLAGIDELVLRVQLVEADAARIARAPQIVKRIVKAKSDHGPAGIERAEIVVERAVGI